jgi:rhodanese-related sulfurtransferase
MNTIIVDVRTRKEFLEGSYPGAINLPSDKFSLEAFTSLNCSHIALVCNSGSRAKAVLNRLKDYGVDNASLMYIQMDHLKEGTPRSQTWSIDRQFRLALGIMIGLALLAGTASYLSITLLAIIFSGLMYSAVTDNCYLKVLISNMPWNKAKANDGHKPVWKAVFSN